MHHPSCVRICFPAEHATRPESSVGSRGWRSRLEVRVGPGWTESGQHACCTDGIAPGGAESLFAPGLECVNGAQRLASPSPSTNSFIGCWVSIHAQAHYARCPSASFAWQAVLCVGEAPQTTVATHVRHSPGRRARLARMPRVRLSCLRTMSAATGPESRFVKLGRLGRKSYSGKDGGRREDPPVQRPIASVSSRTNRRPGGQHWPRLFVASRGAAKPLVAATVWARVR